MYDRIVTSYPHPDTDGVACAIALARLLGGDWRAALAGQLGEETRYVLSRCGIEAPPLLPRLPAREAGLVDTCRLAQLPPGLSPAAVRLVVDHHPGGDAAAFPNARIYNEPVGAAATLLGEAWLARRAAEPEVRRLLAFAILSNTLRFSAPSTTPRDRAVYQQLTQAAPILPEEEAGMFASRAAVLSHGLEAALQADLKLFDSPRYGRAGIAQLELYDLLAHLEPARTELALARVAGARGLRCLLFNGVDLRAEKSLVVCANEESRRWAEELLSLPFSENHAVIPRILLRKTDFLPRMDA